MDPELARRLGEALEDGSALALATVISTKGSTPGRPGFKMLVYRDGTTFGTVGGGELELKVLEAIRAGIDSPSMMRFVMNGDPSSPDGTQMICGGTAEVFLEPLGASDDLFVIGGGHVGAALVQVGRLAGFRVTVYDNRPEFGSRERHPDAHVAVSAPYDELGARLGFSKRAYVAIMTHGHVADELALKQCFGKPYAYLGCIGSKRKVREVKERLLASGADAQELERLYAPIGLDIGSRAAGEIALSIIAQMMAVRRGHETLSVRSSSTSSTPKSK